MKTIHCVAFDPAPDTSTIGGVDWRHTYDHGQELWEARCVDPDFDNCNLTYFEARVPEFVSNAEITGLVEEMAWLQDYRALRGRPAKVAA